MVFTLLFAATARAGDVRVFSSGLLYETGQAAPFLELRLLRDDHSSWRFALEGWTLSATRERPIDQRSRWFASLTATPHDAHSSERIYRDGKRARELEFGDASYSVRLGARLAPNEHASTEVSLIALREVLADDAPASLLERWNKPWLGMRLTQGVRFVSADDPLAGRIDGVAVTANAEGYGGRGSWAKGSLTEEGGMPLGRLHLRESVALMASSNLDTVSAFLTGGSWDALRTSALYGTRYAEFRIERGAIASVGADYRFSTWDVGARASVLRAPSLHKRGAMLQVAHKLGGMRLSLGAGKSNRRTTVVASIGGAVVR